MSSSDVNKGVSTSIYQPLDFNKEEIRLLVLEPALRKDSEICCTLLSTSLRSQQTRQSNIEAYEALSYVWGQPNFSRRISLNSCDYYITPALECILSNLRLEDSKRVLWVDALCINQSDIAERAQQVTLMRKVYANCRRDLAWLGPTPGSMPSKELDQCQKQVAEAMKSMKCIVIKYEETLKSLQVKLESNTKQGQAQVMDEMARLSLRSRRDYLHPEDLQKLFKSQFWRRVWIVQELSCAERVTLTCEGAELEWELVSAFLDKEPYFDAFHKPGDMYGDRKEMLLADMFRGAKIIENQRSRLQKTATLQRTKDDNESTLLDVLARFRDMESTDPRDKIYALLGLVTQQHHIDVDYGKSLKDLYKDVAISLMNLTKDLDIICQNPFENQDRGRISKTSHQADLRRQVQPSWVADFSIGTSQAASVLFAQQGIFRAGTPSLDMPLRFIGSNRSVLVLRGVFLGRIGLIHQRSLPSWRRIRKEFYKEDRRRGFSPRKALKARCLGLSRHDLFSRELSELKTEYDWNSSAGGIMQMYLGNDIFGKGSGQMYDINAIMGTQGTWKAEPAIQACWRTFLRDCTAPPDMRRLSDDEITQLGVINERRLRKGKKLKTCGSSSGSTLHSAFVYDPKDRDSDSDYLPCVNSTRLPYGNKSHMFTLTEDGLYLLTRRHVNQGDIVAVLDGGKVPVILRQVQRNGLGDAGEFVYHFVCVAYVHGFMDGEVEESVAQGTLKKKDILLI